MHIAFLVDTFPKISETFILRQITGLIDRNNTVDIFAWRGESAPIHSDVKTYRLVEYTTHYLPHNVLWRLLKFPQVALSTFSEASNGKRVWDHFRYALGLHHFLPKLGPTYAAYSFLSRPSYDIIHAHFGTNGILAHFMRNLEVINAPIITTFHGHDVQVALPAFPASIRERLFRKGDYFTVNSNFTLQAVQQLGAPSHRTEKLPVGLDMSRYHFQIREYPTSGPVKLLTIGRLVEKKGIEYAIRAVAEVVSTNPNLEYTIVGEGGQRSRLEQLIQDLGMNRHIHLVGNKNNSEVKEYLDSAHLFILSSVTARNGDKEGQGLVLQEAQATGLPILATHHNGFSEGVLDGQSGFLVPERDSSALAERLQFLINHPDLWPEMGQAGRRFVQKNFDIHQLNDRLVEIYRMLCGR